MAKIAMVLAGISITLMVFFVIYLLMVNPKSDYDRKIEDEEQAQWLKKYAENKKKKKEGKKKND